MLFLSVCVYCIHKIVIIRSVSTAGRRRQRFAVVWLKVSELSVIFPLLNHLTTTLAIYVCIYNNIYYYILVPSPSYVQVHARGANIMSWQ